MTEELGPDHGIRDNHARPRSQKVLNEVWPHDAHQIRDHDNPINVRVRVVFEHDGETWLDGRAIRWRRQHVCVQVNDRRSQTGLMWVLAPDVRRR